ncbi:hypothetical protein [Paludisphaera sp.]|uniref:hypothetical protein n=1 Tax=Paludisphaera sp. TaxID=2017432 RepID=UPI00301B78A9
MRLTLRTLLAWLDDKLPPVQVREIGKQVAVSPLAQELVQRIHRVTRQRRLTIPPPSGEEATDPNLVASYLDNDLNAEQVAEYEKKCLVSDVNLAEVASVHQILSLLGQKVQVPHQAKVRMYGLVKGREAQRPADAEAAAPPPQPASQPVAPWTAQTPRRRDWVERYGPAAACLGVLGLLTWSAYESLKPDPARDAVLVAAVPSKAGGAPDGSTPAVDPVAAPRAADPAPRAAAPAPVVDAMPDGLEAGDEPDNEAETANAAPAPGEEAAAPVAVPAGSSAVVARLDGMLLEYDADHREWVRAHEGDGIHAGDRLMSTPNSTARLEGGGGPLTLLEDSEIRALDDPADGGVNIELVRGRILAETSSQARSLHVACQGVGVELQRPAGLAVGVESARRWEYGVAAPVAPALVVHVAAGGELTLKTAKATQKVQGPAVARVDAAGAVTTAKEAAPAEWLSGPEASAERTAGREKFLAEFAEDRPVLADVVSATESDDPDVKAAAVAMLRGLGDLSLLTPILERPEDPVARRAAIAAIREELASGEAAARRAWDQIEADMGAADRARLARLLPGLSAKDATPEAIEELVESLSPREPSLAVRELAYDNLRRSTGREAPAYDADAPEQGYAAWRKLLEDGALKPVAGK